jgi:hypothetical protein
MRNKEIIISLMIISTAITVLFVPPLLFYIFAIITILAACYLIYLNSINQVKGEKQFWQLIISTTLFLLGRVMEGKISICFYYSSLALIIWFVLYNFIVVYGRKKQKNDEKLKIDQLKRLALELNASDSIQDIRKSKNQEIIDGKLLNGQIDSTKEGMGKDRVVTKEKLKLPIYSEDINKEVDNNRPLSYELKNKVNNHIKDSIENDLHGDGLLNDYPEDDSRKNRPNNLINPTVGFKTGIEKDHKNEIEEISQYRGISYLIHFTQLDNLESILKHGIISVSRHKEKNINARKNDLSRFDRCTEATSMSVQFPNYSFFYKKRNENKNIKWVILKIKPKILWEKRCVFCIDNAARNSVSGLSFEERQGAKAFEGLFKKIDDKPTRKELGIPDNYTTNPQAEILVFGEIELDYIEAIVFENKELGKSYYSKINGRARVEVNNGLFKYRQDFRWWSA